MDIESGEKLEQAKKRDHKIIVTGTAISKIPYLEIPGCSYELCAKLQDIHRDLLKKAQMDNGSNEVAVVYNTKTEEHAFVLGDEVHVDVDSDIDVKGIYKRSYAQELVMSHNHPSTSNFSFADIDYFLANEYLSLMTVVTNQGEVYALYKTSAYDYDKIQKIKNDLVKKYSIDEQAEISKEFLKQCQRGGVKYVKGKK